METGKEDKFHSERSTNSEELEKEGEAFVLKLSEILLRRGKLTSAVGDLEVARKTNQEAGQYLSDEVQLVSLHFPNKEIKEMIGIDRGFRSNYTRILNALARGRFKTVGEIRNTDPLMLVRLQHMQMPSVLFVKTIFARPQPSGSR